jgi:hypothetical protein
MGMDAEEVFPMRAMLEYTLSELNPSRSRTASVMR